MYALCRRWILHLQGVSLKQNISTRAKSKTFPQLGPRQRIRCSSFAEHLILEQETGAIFLRKQMISRQWQKENIENHDNLEVLTNSWCQRLVHKTDHDSVIQAQFNYTPY